MRVGSQVTQSLIARGDIVATAGTSSSGSFRNTGDWLELEFGDANLGAIAIEFAKSITGTYALNQGALTLTLAPPMNVALKDLPPDIPLKRYQQLMTIVFNQNDVAYRFKATTAPFEEAEILVDLLKEAPIVKPNPGGKPMPLVMAQPLKDGSGDDDGGSSGQMIVACVALVCTCLKKDDPQNPDPKIPPPVPQPDVWATLFPDCVTKSARVLLDISSEIRFTNLLPTPKARK